MNFISTHCETLKSLECPASYHVFAGLGAVSALVGRKVWSDRGLITTYPNLYVVMADAAGSGKTTAMSYAKKMIKNVPGVNIAPKSPSAKKFMLNMKAAEEEFEVKGKKMVHAPMACFLSEFSNFIALHPQQMMGFLIDAYDDDDFDYETEHKGCFKINGPAPAIVACCTKEWIIEQHKQVTFSDGIGRRVLWLNEGGAKTRNSWPDITDEMRIEREKLISRCMEVKELKGEFYWNDSAKKFWKKWYYDYERKISDKNTRGYYGTKHVQLEKVAMNLAMANRVETQLKGEDFEEGLEYLEMLEKNLANVFEGVGRNELHSVRGDIFQLIKENKDGLSMGEIKYKGFKVANNKEIEEIVLNLSLSGKLKTKQVGGKNLYYLP